MNRLKGYGWSREYCRPIGSGCDGPFWFMYWDRVSDSFVGQLVSLEGLQAWFFLRVSHSSSANAGDTNLLRIAYRLQHILQCTCNHLLVPY